MESEYILYIPESLNTPEFTTLLSKSSIFFQFYTSSKHHPNAILLHRTHFSKKILSSEHKTSCSKVAIIYYPSLSSTAELYQSAPYLTLYRKSNIKTLMIIQGVEDFIEALTFNNSDSIERETFEEWLVKWMLKGIDCILTESVKESIDYLNKITTILSKSPYRPEASIYRLHSKKLLPNTEIDDKHSDWALQLINIPGISEKKALKIIEKYKDLPSLLSFYQDPSIPDSIKSKAFINLTERKEKRISQKIFTLYNSLNPDEIL